jgi:two-component system, cell cycle response regulator DivK
MKKILIAEDNPVNRELLREFLEMQGYEIFEACNGEEALAMLADLRPDLVILDLGMPVLDGFCTIQRIRADPALAHLPALAATAYAMRGDREKTLAAGFDGYLSKPINAAALKKEVDGLLAANGGRKKKSAAAGIASE